MPISMKYRAIRIADTCISILPISGCSTLLISMLPIVWAKCRNLTLDLIGFENSESEPIERNCRFGHLSVNTSGLKIPHLSPYKGAFLLRHFAHTKGKNLINRVGVGYDGLPLAGDGFYARTMDSHL